MNHANYANQYQINLWTINDSISLITVLNVCNITKIINIFAFGIKGVFLELFDNHAF